MAPTAEVPVAKVAVMGAGSWGTVFSMLCHEAGGDVRLWARRPTLAEQINEHRRNHAYLPDFVLPDGVRASADPAEVLSGAEVVVLAIPSIGLGLQLGRWGALVPPGATIVSLVKGVDSRGHFGSEIIIETLECDPARVVVLSGPNLAGECASRLPTASVAASIAPQTARRAQTTVRLDYYRVETHSDLVGVEIAGAVKNVVAVAAGVADGMGYGDNTLAAVITRGLAEMQRLGLALGGDPLTFAGLAGVGDLVATCTSPRSRNRSLGVRLGLGEPLDRVIRTQSTVAEGIYSAAAIDALAEGLGVEMPIVNGVMRVVRGETSPQDAVRGLLGREPKGELEGIRTLVP